MFRQYFKEHGFNTEDGVICQPGFATGFESVYLEVRKREGRLYSDEEVKQLPDFEGRFAQEWIARKKSFIRLKHYLASKEPLTILEIGCGNGWLIHGLSQLSGVDCCGVDINRTELQQGFRVFGNKQNLLFVNGDICSSPFRNLQVDVIILASSLQYFSYLSETLNILQSLLTNSGEIHILDTPLYNKDTVMAATERSERYFAQHQNEVMMEFYHHHSWSDLQGIPYHIQFDPGSWSSRLKNLFQQEVPFPWIVIPKKPN